QLTLNNNGTQIKIGDPVPNRYSRRIERINKLTIHLQHEKPQFFMNHNYRPRIPEHTGQILGAYHNNITSMHVCDRNQVSNAFMILSIDHPVTQDVIDALYEIEGFNLIRSVELDVAANENYNI